MRFVFQFVELNKKMDIGGTYYEISILFKDTQLLFIKSNCESRYI